MLLEEKAIIEVRKLRDANKKNSLGKSIDTVLNLIDRLQKGTEEKDKQIDLMAEYIARGDIEEDICSKMEKSNECDKFAFGECENCIKQYFKSKGKE